MALEEVLPASQRSQENSLKLMIVGVDNEEKPITSGNFQLQQKCCDVPKQLPLRLNG